MDKVAGSVRATTDLDKQIGLRIKLARKAMKFSQSELATAVGVTYQQVQKYENGTDRVAISRLVQIARVLEVGPSSLLGDDGAGAPPLLDDMATTLVAEFGRIRSPALRLAAIQSLKAIVATDRDMPDAALGNAAKPAIPAARAARSRTSLLSAGRRARSRR
ncbi:helix-turn-helix domain-containing protein [Salinarimonas ramus]|uniref:HTH cro/C1-type domain-containing protein n=1 Tax=Salinarimonas ramus TaxID=690164 RepID=A0A917QLR1_9HYPH|nr:helix-turn-helix transcriptional regulator [Salinarimonas ramus]GGK55223.1 hypothetical protein GCM10011322_47380 [Salinarimonas ramus]